MLFGTFCADTEVEFLHALDFIANALERAYRAVGGDALKDVGEGIGDFGGLFCELAQFIIVDGGVGEEDNGCVEDVGILLVLLDIAGAESLEVNTLPDGLFTYSNLFTI